MSETGLEEGHSGEALLFSLARIAKARGDALAVAVLTDAHVRQDSERYDNWNGGMYHVSLRLDIDAELYSKLTPEDRKRICEFIRAEADPILDLTENEDLSSVAILPRPQSVPRAWRDQEKAWLREKDTNGVGRPPPDQPARTESSASGQVGPAFPPPNRTDHVAGQKLSILETRLVERVLQMGNGYVLNFSNPTFADFFAEHNVNIDVGFDEGGTSKANRLRTFLKAAHPILAGKVLLALLDHRLAMPSPPPDKDVEEYRAIASRFVLVPDTYDVTLSFAGEDRTHADAVARGCVNRGIRVFYDDYEKATLWGKDLYQHLSDVYANRARFCVVFVSRHYASKLWTNHELRAAQSRAFTERREYILPVRLDDTQLPGLTGTTGYVEWARHTADEVVGMLAVKLGRAVASPSAAAPPAPPVLDDADILSILESWLGNRTKAQNTSVIHLDAVDRELRLPPGSAARHIEQAARAYNYKLRRKGTGTVVFDPEDDIPF